MKQRYFVFDTEKCIGCFNCLHACKDEHVGNDFSPVTLPQKLHRQYWLTTTQRVRGQFPMIDVAYLTEPCGHCADAPCVKNGNGAVVRRPDGVVLIAPEKARGMGDLSHLCPFGKISSPMPQVMMRAAAFSNGVNVCMAAAGCVQIADLKGEMIALPTAMLEFNMEIIKDFHLISARRRGCYREIYSAFEC